MTREAGPSPGTAATTWARRCVRGAVGGWEGRVGFGVQGSGNPSWWWWVHVGPHVHGPEGDAVGGGAHGVKLGQARCEGRGAHGLNLGIARVLMLPPHMPWTVKTHTHSHKYKLESNTG